ncbi:DUF4363 family protein [Irregularibacter muris]|uniref:DUF4363 family protein n=1 Tax=Irregularibacter muris TaxID=1796619 RepID=A0AAE3HF90_9FIRM|nr:DUF4363 family protein [Irregularibacter muris]MCR1898374.1 DUF4363 family protein [Irregularibacter muris]
MRKFMVVTIPIITLVIFVLIMFGVNFLKNPLGKDDNIPLIIERMEHNVSNERWQEVGEQREELANAWKKVVRRIQFSSERDELNAFRINLARLKGAILAEDKSNALMELKEAHEHWESLGR